MALLLLLLLLVVVAVEVSSVEDGACRTSGRCECHLLIVLLCYPPKAAVRCHRCLQQVMQHMLSGGAQMAAGKMA
jgi:hypothetical protein